MGMIERYEQEQRRLRAEAERKEIEDGLAQIGLLRAENERLRALLAASEQLKRGYVDDNDLLRERVELLQSLLTLAGIDLSAAKRLIEADQLETAYGLEQTIDKIRKALAHEQTPNSVAEPAHPSSDATVGATGESKGHGR